MPTKTLPQTEDELAGLIAEAVEAGRREASMVAYVRQEAEERVAAAKSTSSGGPSPDELVTLPEEAQERGRKSAARSIVRSLMADLDAGEERCAALTLGLDEVRGVLRPRPFCDLPLGERFLQTDGSVFVKLGKNRVVRWGPLSQPGDHAIVKFSYGASSLSEPVRIAKDGDVWKRATAPQGPNAPEPTPSSDGTPVWDLVLDDMKERDAIGASKYGTPLKTHNGRRPLVDLYQELLDAVVYVRQEIEERKRQKVWIVMLGGHVYTIKATEKEAQDVWDELLSSTAVDLTPEPADGVDCFIIGDEADDWKTAP